VPGSIQQGSWCPDCAVDESRKRTRVKKTIEDMHRLAKKRRGKCLSTEYVNSKTKLKWQCSEGDIWEAVPGNIQQGTWCPVCADVQKKTMADMHKLAEKHGGKCLSTVYVNIKTKLKWECSEGDTWEATPNDIHGDHWCPVCADVQKKTMADMHKLAEKHGGKCLSTEYNGAHTKLKWQCSEGDIWEAVPGSTQRGTWCPVCADVQKKTMADMHKLAEKHSGKCLSTEYNGAHTKLKWQCSKGDTWEAKPNSIQQGTWCRTCAVNKRRRKKIGC